MSDAAESTSGPRSAEGLVAVVTGAASGIGAEVCAQLAERGVAAVTLVDLDREGAQRTAEQLPVGLNHGVIGPVDVGDEAHMDYVFRSTATEHGSVDLVFNNAAMMTPTPGLLDADLEVVNRVVATNVRSVLIGMRLAHRHMAGRGGSVVSTASGAGKVPFPSDPLYAATKAAVVNLTRSLAPTFAADRIRVNAVCPSIVDTPMLRADGQPENIDQLLEGVPLLTAEEVATALVDLALDPDATGQTPSLFPR